MTDKEDNGILPVSKKEVSKRSKGRNTGLIRIDKELKDIIKEEAKRTHKTMSRIVDWAVESHFKVSRPLG